MLVVALVTACLFGPRAGAQTTVTFESFGVGNAYRPGGPVAALVAVTSDLDEAVPGLVEWEIPNPDGDLQINRRALEIPGRGGVARTWLLGDLPSRADPTAIADDPWTVRVYEYRDGERVREIASARLTPAVCNARPIEQTRGLAVVIGANDAGLGGYGPFPGRDIRPGLNEYLDVVTGVVPADLPDLWAGLKPVDLLVWTADDSRFQPATLGTRLIVEGALRAWLERGGHLVIALPRTGDPWRLARGDGVLNDLLAGVEPITDSAYPLWQALPALSDRPELRDPDRTITLHRFDPETLPTGWRPLAGFRPAPPPFDESSIEIPEGTPEPVAERLVDAAREAIVAPPPVIHAIRRSVGQGTIDIVGIDPADPDIRVQQAFGLPATWVFWNPILGRRTFTIPASVSDDIASSRELVVANRSEAIGRSPFVNDAIAIRGSAAGGLLLAFVVFAGYWLLAGPLGFMILGRLGMRRHSWVAFVLTSVVAAVVAWITGLLTVDGDVAMKHLTVLRHRYEPADSGRETPLDHATSWFSARLPGYGMVEVAIGEETGEGLVGADLLAYYSPPPNGFGSGFPDVDRYEVDARRRERMVVPSRATSAEFVADWSGRPRADSEAWASTIKVDPDFPVTARMPERGRLSITGRLVNASGVTLEDVLVLVVSPERPGPLPLGGDGLPGVPGTQSRLTAQVPNLGVLVAFDFANGWASGDTLDLGQVTRGGSTKRLPQFGNGSLGDEFDARFALADSALGIGAGLPGWDLQRRLEALSLFQLLPPPPITQQSGGRRQAYRLERLLGRDLDLSQQVAEPSLLVLARAAGVPCPVPISVDGRELPGEGTVLLQWVHPLPAELEWLVPPRPDGFPPPPGDEDETPTESPTRTTARTLPDPDAFGVAQAWR